MKNLPQPIQQRPIMSAQAIAYIAFFAATLTGGKLALSALPNIEIVTVLVLVYASVFGIKYVLPATLIFCTVEAMLYGFGSWVILYYIYWNTMGVLASLLLKKQKIWQALVFTVVSTIMFGMLSTAIETVLMCMAQETAKNFFKFFVGRYMLGIWFFVSHVIGNIATALFLYKPLCVIFGKFKNKLLE